MGKPNRDFKQSAAMVSILLASVSFPVLPPIIRKQLTSHSTSIHRLQADGGEESNRRSADSGSGDVNSLDLPLSSRDFPKSSFRTTL
jgi:hypothetical protein